MCLGDAHHCKTSEKMSIISVNLNIHLSHRVLPLLCSISKIFSLLSHSSPKKPPKIDNSRKLLFPVVCFSAEVLQVWSGLRTRFLLSSTCVLCLSAHTVLIHLSRPPYLNFTLKCVAKERIGRCNLIWRCKQSKGTTFLQPDNLKASWCWSLSQTV